MWSKLIPRVIPDLYKVMAMHTYDKRTALAIYSILPTIISLKLQYITGRRVYCFIRGETELNKHTYFRIDDLLGKKAPDNYGIELDTKYSFHGHGITYYMKDKVVLSGEKGEAEIISRYLTIDFGAYADIDKTYLLIL